MKYLVNIESLDYPRQRDLETKFQSVLVKNSDEKYENYIVFDDIEKAEKLENAIKALDLIDQL